MLLFSGIFFIVWGSLFAGGPLYMFISSFWTGKFEITTLFFLVFVVVGGFVFSMGVRNIIKFFKIKTIRLFGKTTIAIYDSCEEHPSENNFSFAVIVSFKDKYGNTIKRKTDYKYSTEDIDYFIKKHSFRIRYSKTGNVIITDEPSIFQQLYTAISTNIKGEEAEPKYVISYHCPYCKGKQTKPGKCKNCGANVEEKKEYK